MGEGDLKNSSLFLNIKLRFFVVLAQNDSFATASSLEYYYLVVIVDVCYF